MDTKQYWTTGSIKVSTPEEVEELKKVAFKPLPKEGIWNIPMDEITQMAKERSDMIRSIPSASRMPGRHTLLCSRRVPPKNRNATSGCSNRLMARTWSDFETPYQKPL